MKSIKIIKTTFVLTLISLCCTIVLKASDLSLETVAIYKPQSGCKTTEIVSIQETTNRLALSCSSEGVVEVISIEIPSQPTPVNSFKVSDDEEISAVAFHPIENVFAVAVINNDPFANGKIQIHDASSGEITNTLEAGVHPEGIAFSANGKHLVVANEGEAYHYNGKSYESPEGSVTLVDFTSANQAKVTQIKLEDFSGVEGMMHKKHARKFERIVTGGNSNEEIKISIKDNSPSNTEPEFVTFLPDGSKAYISLQENNGILVINTSTAKIEKVFGLGMTEHLADLDDNEKVKFNDTLIALREPDGIAVTSNGKYLLTADEGDTDPKASKTLGKKPKGGGRTLSIFDATSGAFISDTTNQLDEIAHAAGLYPDGRSDSKGSEPENVVSFTIQDVLYAAVGLERANAIALVSLENPSQPNVISVNGVDPKASIEGQYAPEGLAYFKNDDRHFIFSANEKSGTMTVMEVTVSDQIVSN